MPKAESTAAYNDLKQNLTRLGANENNVHSNFTNRIV